MVPLISYLPATMSPGASVGLNEYSWPHLGQNPPSRLSFASQLEQKRLRSGTCGAMRTASGSCGGKGGLGSARAPPRARAVRPLRVEPVRALRDERVLRALRVDGVRPDPVRADPPPSPVDAAPIGAGAPFGAGAPKDKPGAATPNPHTLQ